MRGFYYFSEDVLRSTAIRHGALAERPYAEGFDIIRIVREFSRRSLWVSRLISVSRMFWISVESDEH